MFFPARYLADTAEEFCNGDASAFAFFGGIPVPALYDNTRLVVAKILGDRAGKCSTLFAALHSHYVFEDRYGWAMTRARSGGFPRGTFMVPFPRARDFVEGPAPV